MPIDGQSRGAYRRESRFRSTIGEERSVGGLYLLSKNGSRSWIYMFFWHGKQCEMGLGSFPVVSLIDARQRRDKWRKVLLDGSNPIEVRKAGKSATVTKTFGQAADELIESPRKANGFQASTVSNGRRLRAHGG
jgi:Arm domain-containing DNA-binding protein